MIIFHTAEYSANSALIIFKGVTHFWAPSLLILLISMVILVQANGIFHFMTQSIVISCNILNKFDEKLHYFKESPIFGHLHLVISTVISVAFGLSSTCDPVALASEAVGSIIAMEVRIWNSILILS